MKKTAFLPLLVPSPERVRARALDARDGAPDIEPAASLAGRGPRQIHAEAAR